MDREGCWPSCYNATRPARPAGRLAHKKRARAIKKAKTARLFWPDTIQPAGHSSHTGEYGQSKEGQGTDRVTDKPHPMHC